MTDTEHKITLGRAGAYIVPFIVSVGLCWVLFSNVNLAQMADIVRRDCTPGWIGLAMLISVLSHVLRAARWRLQLNALGIVCSMWELTLSIFGTYAVNLVFPRLGEIWRTAYISRRSGAPFTQVFGSMMADRLTDILTVLLMVGATFALASRHMADYLAGSAEALQGMLAMLASPWTWGAAMVLVAALILYIARGRGRVADKLRETVRGLWRGFIILASMPGRGRWLLLTLGVWGCYFLQLYVAFYAFPFTAALASGAGGTLAVLVAFCLSSVAMGVPSNGGIGPWQWAIIFALGSYGIGTTEAAAFANLVLGANTLMLIVLGIFTFACITISNNHRKK